MIKTALVGALLLLPLAPMDAQANSWMNFATNKGATTGTGTQTISVGQIATLKAALQLTPAQQRHWPAAESALRRFSSGAISAKSAMAAARPLIRTLNATQKQTAVGMARAAGLSQLAAAF